MDSTDPHAAILLGQKWSIPTTLGISSTTITWGQTINVTPGPSPGSVPQGFQLTGWFQLYVDGQKYRTTQPVGSMIAIADLSATVGQNPPQSPHRLWAEYLSDVDFNESTTGTVYISVVQATLTVAAVDQSRTYGEQNPGLTYTISGFVNDDFFDQSKVGGAPVFSTTAAGPASTVGIYPITITQGALSYADPNYTIASTSLAGGKLTIKPAPLVVAALNQGAFTVGRTRPWSSPTAASSMARRSAQATWQAARPSPPRPQREARLESIP